MVLMACLGLALGAEGAWANDPATTTSSEAPRFTCQQQNGRWQVMYTPASRPTEAYAWATPEDMGSAWPAARRCQAIAARLEDYRPDGLLELKTGIENGYNTVCVTTEKVSQCRIVFTVPPGQDAITTRDRVFNNLTLADQGQRTEGVTTFAGGSTPGLEALGQVLNTPGLFSPLRQEGIPLRPFLDPADGGTGAYLNRSGRPLNPNQFR